jgi:hypothetical protein
VVTKCFKNHLATFHLAQPMHTSWTLCETLQHLPTLQGHKERSMDTYIFQTSNKS